MKSPKGARLAFEACVRGPRHEQLTPLLLELLHWTRNEPRERAVYDVLDAPSIAELFALSCTAGRRDQVAPIEQILTFFVGKSELDAQPFLALAADEHRPREVRLRALKLAAAKGGPGFKELLFSFLRSAQPEGSMTKDSNGSSQFELLASAAWAWPDLSENLGELCTDAKIGDFLALRVASSARKWNDSAFDAPTTHACLQRWARLDEGSKGGLVDVLYFLDPRVDAAVLELWKAGYRDRRFSQRIVTAMGKFPIDESVPLLADAVSAEWMSGDSGEREFVRNSAISALTTRLDDLGADALLKAIAAAPDEETRKKCFDGLAQIRKYQDEKQSWQRRKGGEAAREQAIADLLPMLSEKDASIRAAAARSLATLQAVEHLPKLVALLKDKDASVREAAQKALDALNAPAAKKP